MAKGACSPAKNDRVGSVEAPSSVLAGAPWCVGKGHVVEGVTLEHAGADAFRELFYLFFDAGKEGIRAPAADEHDSVDLFPGQVHHHCEGGTH